jgi:hypothetical protein
MVEAGELSLWSVSKPLKLLILRDAKNAQFVVRGYAAVTQDSARVVAGTRSLFAKNSLR